MEAVREKQARLGLRSSPPPKLLSLQRRARANQKLSQILLDGQSQLLFTITMEGGKFSSGRIIHSVGLSALHLFATIEAR